MFSKRKFKYIMLAIYIFVMAVNLSNLFAVEVTAADGYEPENGDFGMSTSVDLTNLTVYQVNATALLFGKVEPVQKLLYLPRVQILSASSNRAMFNSYQALKSGYSFMSHTIPSITSFSLLGYQRISAFYPITTIPDQYLVNPNPKIDSQSGQSSATELLYLSSLEKVNKFDIFNLINTYNATLNETDFDVRGKEDMDKLKFKPIDVYTADVRAYENISSNNVSGTLNPDFEEYASKIEAAASTGIIRAEDMSNVQETKTQQTFFAGYANMTKEAIEDPVKNFVIASQKASGNYLTPNQIVLNYSGINDILTDTQISESLRNHMVRPLQDEVDKKNNNGGFPLAIVNVKFLGFMNVFSVQRVNAGLFDIKLPNVNLGGFVNTLSNVANTGCTVVIGCSLAKTAIDAAKGFSKDGLAGVSRAVMNNPYVKGASSVLNIAGSAIKGGVDLLGKGVNELASLPGKALNAATGGILSTIMTVLSPFLPFIIAGIGILLLIWLGPMLLPKILGGILFRKK